MSQSLSLRHQKRTQPRHGLQTAAQMPSVPESSAPPQLRVVCVASIAEWAAVTPPGHKGDMSKQWARVSSLERRGCFPFPGDPEGKLCFSLDLLVYCRKSAGLLPFLERTGSTLRRSLLSQDLLGPLEGLATLFPCGSCPSSQHHLCLLGLCRALLEALKKQSQNM